MRKAATVLASTLLMATLVLATTGLASANHLWATGEEEHRINLFACFFGVTEIDYPADTGFFVVHGWISSWIEDSPMEKRGFMSPATKFELLIDGEPQKSSMIAPYFPDTDIKLKSFVSEFHAGMSGTHAFRGNWYLDGSLIGGNFRDPILLFTCEFTVHFVV